MYHKYLYLADIYFLLIIRTAFAYHIFAMSKSLYAFFKCKENKSFVKSILPDPKGPLSEGVLSLAISEVQKKHLILYSPGRLRIEI